jgi:hypothetical protein
LLAKVGDVDYTSYRSSASGKLQAKAVIIFPVKYVGYIHLMIHEFAFSNDENQFLKTEDAGILSKGKVAFRLLNQVPVGTTPLHCE